MLAVAKLAGTKWLSPWVVFCAVACIGVGIGTGAIVDNDVVAEVRGQMHVLPFLSFVFWGGGGKKGERYLASEGALTRG